MTPYIQGMSAGFLIAMVLIPIYQHFYKKFGPRECKHTPKFEVTNAKRCKRCGKRITATWKLT